MLSFKLASSPSPFTFIKRLFSYSLLSEIKVVSSAYLIDLSPGTLLLLSHVSHIRLCATP